MQETRTCPGPWLESTCALPKSCDLRGVVPSWCRQSQHSAPLCLAQHFQGRMNMSTEFDDGHWLAVGVESSWFILLVQMQEQWGPSRLAEARATVYPWCCPITHSQMYADINAGWVIACANEADCTRLASPWPPVHLLRCSASFSISSAATSTLIVTQPAYCSGAQPAGEHAHMLVNSAKHQHTDFIGATCALGAHSSSYHTASVPSEAHKTSATLLSSSSSITQCVHAAPTPENTCAHTSWVLQQPKQRAAAHISMPVSCLPMRA
jgi:hypothetical protein